MHPMTLEEIFQRVEVRLAFADGWSGGWPIDWSLCRVLIDLWARVPIVDWRPTTINQTLLPQAGDKFTPDSLVATRKYMELKKQHQEREQEQGQASA